MDELIPELDSDHEIESSDEMVDELNSEPDAGREIDSADKKQHFKEKEISDEMLESFDPEIRILILKRFPNRLIHPWEWVKLFLALPEPNRMLMELTPHLSGPPDDRKSKSESLKRALDQGGFENYLDNAYVVTQDVDRPKFLEGHPLIREAKTILLLSILKALRIVLGQDGLKARLNKPGPSGKRLLTEAIRFGHVSMVHKLLSYGADPVAAKAWDTINLFSIARPDSSQQIRDLLDWSEYSELGQVFVRARRRWMEADKLGALWGNEWESELWTCIAYLKEKNTWPPQNKDRSVNGDLIPDSASVTWIHVPTTNGLIILTILREMGAAVEKIFYERLREPSSPPLDLMFKYREPGAWKGQTADPDAVMCNAVVFPCLALTTIKRYKKQRQKHKDLKRRFPRKECPIYFERTLDEAYCPRLPSNELHKRNEEQIVSRSTRRWKADQDSSPADDDAPILMVAELWLWRVGDTIVSASSLSEASTILKHPDAGGFPELVWRATPAQLVDYIEEQPYPEIQLGMIIASFIDGFGQGYTSTDTKHPSTLDLFDVRVQYLLSELRGYMAKRQRDLNYRQEQYFLLDILDVRSELAMIHSVLKQQEQVLRDLINDFTSSESSRDCTSSEPSHPSDAGQNLAGSHAGWPDWSPVNRALVTLKRYQERVTKIDGDAERVEKAVQDLLNLKRTFASMEDTRSSLILSKAVIGFTLVTIIFAPLAFLTALFALKVEGFGRLQIPGLDGVYDSGKLGGVLFSSVVLTLALTIGLVWISNIIIEVYNPQRLDEDRKIPWTITWYAGLLWFNFKYFNALGKNADEDQEKKGGVLERSRRWIRSIFRSRKTGNERTDGGESADTAPDANVPASQSTRSHASPSSSNKDRAKNTPATTTAEQATRSTPTTVENNTTSSPSP